MYHITVEQVTTEEGIQWKATVAEFPDVAEFDENLFECITLIGDSICCLREKPSES